jgi:hypothetical protein
MNGARSSRSSAVTFGAVVVTFFFTFANISCQGQRVASLSGVQLAFGTQIDQSDMWGNKRPQQVRAEPLAQFALLSAVVGAVLALIGSAARRLAAITGGAGALLLMMLISKMQREATAQSSGLLQISAGAGLLFAIVLFFLAAGMAWFSGRDRTVSVAARAPDKLPDLS